RDPCSSIALIGMPGSLALIGSSFMRQPLSSALRVTLKVLESPSQSPVSAPLNVSYSFDIKGMRSDGMRVVSRPPTSIIKPAGLITVIDLNGASVLQINPSPGERTKVPELFNGALNPLRKRSCAKRPRRIWPLTSGVASTGGAAFAGTLIGKPAT